MPSLFISFDEDLNDFQWGRFQSRGELMAALTAEDSHLLSSPPEVWLLLLEHLAACGKRHFGRADPLSKGTVPDSAGAVSQIGFIKTEVRGSETNPSYGGLT